MLRKIVNKFNYRFALVALGMASLTACFGTFTGSVQEVIPFRGAEHEMLFAFTTGLVSALCFLLSAEK